MGYLLWSNRCYSLRTWRTYNHTLLILLAESFYNLNWVKLGWLKPHKKEKSQEGSPWISQLFLLDLDSKIESRLLFKFLIFLLYFQFWNPWRNIWAIWVDIKLHNAWNMKIAYSTLYLSYLSTFISSLSLIYIIVLHNVYALHNLTFISIIYCYDCEF